MAAASRPAVAAFVEEARAGSAMEADLATMEKQGVDTGLVVRHPLTGADVPVWVGKINKNCAFTARAPGDAE